MKRSTIFLPAIMAFVLLLPALAGCSGSASVATPPAEAGCSATSASAFKVQTYGDALHEQAQCRFVLGKNAAAYVLMQNVATSGAYVMYVQSSGADPSCTYMSPKGRIALPRPGTSAHGAKALCETTKANVTGVNAPGGNVSFSWPFKATLQPGTYVIGVYDQNADGGTGAILGASQVTLIPAGS